MAEIFKRRVVINSNPSKIHAQKHRGGAVAVRDACIVNPVWRVEAPVSVGIERRIPDIGKSLSETGA